MVSWIPGYTELGSCKGACSAEQVQEMTGSLREGLKDKFFKEKPGNSLGRIHRDVVYNSCGQLQIVSSINTITVV